MTRQPWRNVINEMYEYATEEALKIKEAHDKCPVGCARRFAGERLDLYAVWVLGVAQDLYKHEATTERTVVCGGDGGSTTCGCTGYFLAWLALATAYRDNEFSQWLASDDAYSNEILTRPVIDLS